MTDRRLVCTLALLGAAVVLSPACGSEPPDLEDADPVAGDDGPPDLGDSAADPGSDFYRAFARFAQVFLVLEEAALQQHSPGGGIAPIRTRERIRSTS